MSVAKQFEKNVAEQIKQSGRFIMRLNDSPFPGAFNICDYIGYEYPHMYCFEMKTCETPSLPIKNISEGQYFGLLNAEQYGIIAGILVWWINHDVSKFIPMHEVIDIEKTRKSIPHDTEYGITLEGTKKHKYFTYNWDKFFKEVGNGSVQYKQNASS